MLGTIAFGAADNGTHAVELLDATGAGLSAGAYAGASQLAVARVDARAVALSLPGVTSGVFVVVGGNPGASTGGSVEVIVDR